MEKIKHNHCLTDILKVSLFSLLMLAPLLASVSQMLYVTLNKNAKDSYSGTSKFENTITELSDFSEFYENLTYEANYKNTIQGGTTYSDIFYFDTISFNPTDFGFENTTYKAFRTRNDGYFYLYDSFGNTTNKLIWGTSLSSFSFVYNHIEEYTKPLTSYSGGLQFIYVSLQTQKLDNAFYYGVDQMTKSDLFNWTQNTGIYTGVHAMTSGIGIESQFIPMLLTYWLVLTIVYIIIDVVIETFKYLTHILQNKVKSKTS